MNFKVRMFYTDEKVIELELPEDQIPKFCEALKNNNEFWDESKSIAFWTPSHSLRYVNLFKIPEEKKEEEQKDVVVEEEVKE